MFSHKIRYCWFFILSHPLLLSVSWCLSVRVRKSMKPQSTSKKTTTTTTTTADYISRAQNLLFLLWFYFSIITCIKESTHIRIVIPLNWWAKRKKNNLSQPYRFWKTRIKNSSRCIKKREDEEMNVMMKQKKTRWKTNTHRQIQTTTQLTTICLQNYGNGINEGREKFNKTRREKKTIMI